MKHKRYEYMNIDNQLIDVFKKYIRNTSLYDLIIPNLELTVREYERILTTAEHTFKTKREANAAIKKIGQILEEDLNTFINIINDGVTGLLRDFTKIIPKVDWENMIKAAVKEAIKSIEQPAYPKVPPQPKFSWFTRIFRPKLVKDKMHNWEKTRDKTLRKIQVMKEKYEREIQERKNQAKEEVYKFKAAFENGERWAVEKYFSTIIREADYPLCWKRKFKLAYNENNKILLVDFYLPVIEEVPNFKEAKYIAKDKRVKLIYMNPKETEKLYDNLLYQIVIKNIYELFAADEYSCGKGYIESIVFNGRVDTIDKRTGKPINPCILTIHVSKEDFYKRIEDISKVDAKECFRYFKGVGSPKLHLVTPVAPIIQYNKEDDRFVEGHSVIEQVNEGLNLASMDWIDFENLIRDLFEKEFKSKGAEVKITRASRDRGVDAVVFDPDPIKGGKIILQAKRYTNIVEVAAVRDLYGTVINEGATKGILITTSDFGPEAYEFAKDKPITLINGAGLLHLLEKHGYKAYIDLQEAKKQLKITD